MKKPVQITVQSGPCIYERAHLLNVFTALKGTHFYILFRHLCQHIRFARASSHVSDISSRNKS